MTSKKNIEEYFKILEDKINLSYEIAKKAREMGYDPEDRVDIPLVKGISQRVEGLISVVAPQILNSGVSQQIEVLEKEFGSLDWRVALKISLLVAKQKFCKFKDNKEAMEVGIRVGLAYITLGVIAAPLEGFIELKIKKRKDGEEYVAPFFAGPIRAAGGTASALTLLITDYVRKFMGYKKYDPTEEEIKRYITEIQDYHERATNLQYFPSGKEIRFLAKNLPIEINGDPTEKIDVSNHKDLERIETNKIRGGMCLVFAEGLAQKAPKVFKQIDKWGEKFGLEWGFLKEFLKIQKLVKAKGSVSEKETNGKISPNFTYIKDLVAGRPVLSHPLKVGGFRLRYGRTRTSGFAADSLHPATMRILNNYIATGTQLKVERPGKATAISPCDYIEGPIIKLKNGDVLKIESEEEIKPFLLQIENIIYLGDILVNYGDFSENGHSLVPAGYCEEWWILEFEKSLVSLYGSMDYGKVSKEIGIEEEILKKLFINPIKTKISFDKAIKISKKFKIPLHPRYTLYWNAVSSQDLKRLYEQKEKLKIEYENEFFKKIILPFNTEIKSILEKLGVPHQIASKEFIVIKKEYAKIIYIFLWKNDKIDINEGDNRVPLEILNSTLKINIRDKLGTFIGARMGRPEKAKQRRLKGSPHVLFPVGQEGGRLRSFQSALEAKKITADFPIYKCEKCNNKTIMHICEKCNNKTTRLYNCNICGIKKTKCDKDDRKQHISKQYKNYSIDIDYYFNYFLKKSGLPVPPDLIKGVRGTSNKNHEPENLLKGILRAKNEIYVNKDGTTRYDMIEMPITHFKQKEIGISLKKLNELGYKYDIYGDAIENGDQIIEIFPQDQILPDSQESPDEFCSEVLIRICNFVDDLLVRLYEKKPFYNVKNKQDLIGHLVIGLAPHTSAGMVGRIIGFSKTQCMYSHPMYHAAMRRNCDGDEACVMMLMDGLLNFSRTYLPDKRGSRTMDAPLVLTSILIPSEVDDEVHGMDIVWKYPLELYEAANNFKNPWEIDIKQIDNVLGKDEQYYGMGFTHHTSDINQGVRCSSYKTLPSMEEKLKGQMDLAVKINAVDSTDVARLVIEKHFIKDIKGNLRKFSLQVFRCVKCNEKYRRPPLIGTCTECGGKIIFTISEGSIVKYLEPAMSLAKNYNVSPYLIQSLELVKRRIEDVFGKEKDKQVGLGAWFG